MSCIGIILLAVALFPYAIVYNRLFRKTKHADERIIVMTWFNLSQAIAVAVLLIYHFITGG